MSARAILPAVMYSGIIGALGMLGGMALARGLGPVLRGELAAILGWSGTITAVFDLGIGFAVGYFAGRQPERTSRLLSQALFAATFLGIPLQVIAGFFVLPRLQLSNAPYWLQWVLLSQIPIGLASGYLIQLTMGLGLIRTNNGSRLFSSVIYTGVCAILLFHGYHSIEGYGLAYIFAQIALVLVIFIWTIKVRSIRLIAPSSSGARELLNYGIRSHLASLAGLVSLKLDQLVMSVFLPIETLGQYVVALAVSTMTAPLFSGLAVVATPRIVSAPTAKQGVIRGIRYLAVGILSAMIISTFLAIVADVVVNILFGSQFSNAVRSSQVLLFASVFQGSNLILSTILRGVGQPTGPAIGEVFGMFTTIVLLSALLPSYGILGAAYASLCAYGITTFVQVILLKRTTNVTFAEIGLDWRGIFDGFRSRF